MCIRDRNRTLSQLEYDTVVNELLRLGLTDGYVQELESAREDFIPPFEKLEISVSYTHLKEVILGNFSRHDVILAFD